MEQIDRQRRRLGLSLLIAAGATACKRQAGAVYQPSYADRPALAASRKYIFGILPQHNPARLFAFYGPLLDYLNAGLAGVSLLLEAARNYGEFEERIAARHFDLILPNPYQTLLALAADYRVFGKMGDDQNFHGLIIARNDSGIHEVADLAGKAISFPAPTALAASMLPQRYLHDHGLPISRYEQRYVGSQESSIMNAYLGNTAACATWPPPWQAFARESPTLARQMQVLWTTDSLPNNSLMARADFPAELLALLGEMLFSLHLNAAGKKILERISLSRFEPANAAVYQPVRRFVEQFARDVRPLAERAS